MAQNREIGELGQIINVDTSANSMTVNGSVIVGNSSSNVVINSTAISVGGITETDRSFTWTNTHTFTNTVSIAALSANGTLGVSSQVLTTNGTGIYWSSAGVNTNATYTWSNAHTFNGVVTFAQTAVGTVNNALYLNGTDLSTLQDQITSNASAAYTNAVSYTDSKILTANSAITGNATTAYTNAVSYIDTVVGNVNSAITANASAAYTNAVSYADGKILTANSAITGNAATAYTNATIFASNASNINTGTIAEARLPYRMNQDVRNTDNVTFGQMTLTGNLVVSGNVNIIGANNLSISDNMIYLNSNNDVANPDIGIAANYNDGTYHHTGIFRDASDGYWKVFDNYDPEPDANVYIDTTNTSFHLANFQANGLSLGNTSTSWVIGNTSGVYTTGTINAASHTVGTAFTANATVVNAVSYYAGSTLIGNTTGPYGKTEGSLNVNSALTSNNSTNLGGTAAASYQLNSTLNANIASYLPTYTGVVNATTISTGSVNVINASGLTTTANVNIGAAGELVVAAGAGIYANGGLGSAGQVLTSNATSVYWASPASSGVTSITQGTGLSFSASPITSTGTISLATAGAGAASYSSGISALTVDAYGRVTSVTGSAGYTTGSGYLPLSGGTMTGLLVGQNPTTSGVGVGNDAGSFSIRGDTTRSAHVSFHRSGAYAINMGLDTDNVFRFGGWSDGSTTYRLQLATPGGTSTLNGILTATTDMRAPIFYDSNDTIVRWDAGTFVLRSGSPTIFFRDTDHNSAMLHNNSNLFYILRGGNDTESWSTVGSGWWPMTVNLTNNNVDWGGNITAAYNVTAYASDRRLKENIKDITNAIEKIKAIRGVTFDWNDTAEENGFVPERKYDDIGCIAQEVQAILPHVVTLAPFDRWKPDPGKDYTDEELDEKMDTSRSGENYLTIQYERMIPLLIQAIKEQQEQIEELKRRL